MQVSRAYCSAVMVVSEYENKKDEDEMRGDPLCPYKNDIKTCQAVSNNEMTK